MNFYYCILSTINVAKVYKDQHLLLKNTINVDLYILCNIYC